jgi:hypothetical protein
MVFNMGYISTENADNVIRSKYKEVKVLSFRDMIDLELKNKISGIDYHFTDKHSNEYAKLIEEEADLTVAILINYYYECNAIYPIDWKNSIRTEIQNITEKDIQHNKNRDVSDIQAVRSIVLKGEKSSDYPKQVLRLLTQFLEESKDSYPPWIDTNFKHLKTSWILVKYIVVRDFLPQEDADLIEYSRNNKWIASQGMQKLQKYQGVK